MTTEVDASSQFTTFGAENAIEVFTPQELRTLAARASTLQERHTGQFVPVNTRKNIAVAKNRFSDWVKSASGGDRFLMSDILTDRNIDPSKAETLFGEVELAEGQPVPEWTELFSQLNTATKDRNHSAETHNTATNSLFPYKQIFYPFVEIARHIRDGRAKDIWLQYLTSEALSDLDLALLALISDCCTNAVKGAEKNKNFETDDGSIFFYCRDKPPQMEGGNRHNIAFQTIGKEGVKKFFCKRPVLARLITTMIEQWLTTTLEFMERLYNDLDTEIYSLTNFKAPGKVRTIEQGLSEIYDEGKSVYKLTFENDLSVGYKPKDLRIDRAWNGLIEWLDNQGAPDSAGVPNTRVCDGYGWVKWIEPKPCRTPSEAEEFFQRSGATLCLIRLLNGNDFHHGNIIASGTVPFPLDLETILQAQPKNNTQIRGAERAFEMASDVIGNSVLSTGYLPSWYSAPNGKAVRLGGLDITEISSPSIDNITRQSRQPPKTNGLFQNVPSLNGTLLEVGNYEEFLIAGYEAMFGFLMKSGSGLCAPDGPLNSFQKVTFRSILRSTHVYTHLMENALKPQNLGNGALWSSYFDTLYFSEITQQDFTATPAFRNYERTSLSTFNIPIFSGSPMSTNLVCGDNHVIDNFFCCPCLAQVRSRLQKLDPALLEQDRLMIRQSISVTKSIKPAVSIAARRKTPVASLGKKTIIEAVKDLENAINKSALKAGGGATWLGLLPVTADERKLQLSILPPALFCGTLGIGLLQAALYKITGEEIYRTHAIETTAIVLERAHDIVKMHQLGHSMSLGLGTGVGGIIYALVTLADMLKKSQYLSIAHTFAQTITPATISSSKDFGLMSGVAGAIIGLQAFYHRYPSPEIAHKIRDCGRLLLTRSITSPSGSKAWRSQSWSSPLTGLMHGASGIALALSRAAQVFSLPQFNEAAVEGLEYESALLGRYGAWPDLRDIEDTAAISQAPHLSCYANGIAGIGLVRLELEALNRPYTSYSGDIERAVEKLSGQRLLEVDDLFSGNLGILYFLVRAARQTGRKELEEQALSQISGILKTAKENGNFQWRVGTDADNPGFFNGAAGIGMALLQIAAPDQIPDILSLKHTG